MDRAARLEEAIARAVRELRRRLDWLSADASAATDVVNMSIFFTLVVSVLLLLPCALQLLLHLYLLSKGRTLYEWQQVRAGTRRDAPSPFDYGWLNNFALTFGVYPLMWLLPTRKGVEGNGIFFPEQEGVAAVAAASRAHTW